jgi:hypothetical protein
MLDKLFINDFKEKIINIYIFPFLFLPILFLLVSNLFFSLIGILLLISYIFYFRKELLYNKIFWVIYYFFLSSQYFLIGYFGGYYENSLFIAKLVVGLIQFLPIYIFLLLLLNRNNLKIIKNFKFTIFYFIYLILIIVLHNNLNLDGLVLFRNFSIFIISFFVGIFVAKYISISSYFKSLIPLLLVYVLFGYFEQSQGWIFWRDWFNSYFVTDLKSAGQSMYGMIGDKTTAIKGEVYLRMSSVYYEPHHLSLTLAYFIFIFYALKKTKLLHLKWFVFLQLFIFLFVALLLTLVKAGYGLFILAFIWLYLLKLIKPKNKKSYFFSMLVINIGIVGILLFILLNIGLGSTANTHLNAALAVFKLINPMLLLFGATNEFQVLNSDSGFATIVFSIGLIGYLLFLLVLAEILTYLNKNSHPIKYYMMALVFAWFGTTHLVSSTWSPMVSFLLFFLIGLSTGVVKKDKDIEKNIINK